MIIQKYNMQEQKRRPLEKKENKGKDRNKKIVLRYDRYLNDYFYYTEVFKDFHK